MEDLEVLRIRCVALPRLPQFADILDGDVQVIDPGRMR